MQTSHMHTAGILKWAPPYLVYKFPFKLGDAWASAVEFTATGYWDDKGTFTETNTVVGKNSIVLPQGTYPICYLVQFKDQWSSIDGTSYTKIRYVWLVPGVGQVVQIVSAKNEQYEVFTQATYIERLFEIR